MNCTETRRRLPLWVGGDLPDDENAALQEHLARCAECRIEAERWRADHESLRRAARHAETPSLDPALLERMLASDEIGPRAPRRPLRGTVARWAGPLAALLAVFLFWRFVEVPLPERRAPAMRAEHTASWEELQEAFDGCLGAPTVPERWQAEAASGLVAVLARTETSGEFVVADCIEVRDLRRLRGYPWLQQRLDRYRRGGTGERDILVAVCPTAGMDRADRRSLRGEVLRRFGPSG